MLYLNTKFQAATADNYKENMNDFMIYYTSVHDFWSFTLAFALNSSSNIPPVQNFAY
jgi:hypothetical protein